MVKARFDETTFTPIDSSLDHGPINILEDEIAKVVATFKTTQYRGKIGCPALMTNKAEMRRVVKDNTLDCVHATMPALLNPKITKK